MECNTVTEMPLIESLLEDIRFTSNRIDSLADTLDTKLNGPIPMSNEPSQLGGIQVGIISKLESIKKGLVSTEKKLEEQIKKM